MRVALWTLIVLGVGVSGMMASSAFSFGSMPRAINVTIVGDSAAYLSIAAYSGGSHRCFVDTTNGQVSITFDTPSSPCLMGTGAGINAGDADATKYSRYAFHDLLVITNNGPKTLNLWVNATRTGEPTSAIEVALKSTTGAMADSDYGTAKSRTGVTITTPTYVGVRVTSGTLAASNSVAGSIRVEARA